MIEPYKDIREIGRFTGLPLSWLYSKAAAGEIPHIKAGKYLRFRLSEVEAWLAQHRRGGNAYATSRPDAAEGIDETDRNAPGIPIRGH